MAISIDSDDPRSIRAVELAARAPSWLKLRTHDGQAAYGIRASRDPDHVHVVTESTCTCADSKWHPEQVCKHRRAVRFWLELVKGQHSLNIRHRQTRRGKLDAAHRANVSAWHVEKARAKAA